MKLIAVIVATLSLSAVAQASAGPVPRSWLPDAICVHEQESSDWHYGPEHHGSRPWSGYYNGFQFLKSTWLRAEKLTGLFYDIVGAPIWVQVRNAYAIFHDDGDSWKEWGPRTLRNCHLN